MTLLNWLPEIYLLILLFVTLIVMNFKLLSYRSLSLIIAGVSLVGLVYFICRDDLAYFDSPLKTLLSDSLSHFGRMLALFALAIFSMSYYFHRTLSFEAKQNTNLFLVFYAFFAMGLFQSNSLVLFLGASLGIYLSATNLVLIESGRSQAWIATFRMRVLPISVWSLTIALLFLMGVYLFGSIYLSDWVIEFPRYAGSQSALFIFSFLVLLASMIPLGALRYVGNAPIGISILCFSLFLVQSVFWLRLGVPFFSLSTLLTKSSAQILLSLLLGGFTLVYAWHTVRTRDHHRWFASALPTIVGLSLFLILLPGAQALPAFYCITISLLLSFSLIAHAFLTDDYQQKALLVFSTVALMGLPPLILGEQLYRVIHQVVLGGNLVAGILMIASWLGLTLGITRKISKVLLVRCPVTMRRRIYTSELFFAGFYLVCVIALTIFRVEFVALLNEHPVLNLW